jgi:RNA polymerase sigma-70 factor (sigma-E family)
VEEVVMLSPPSGSSVESTEADDVTPVNEFETYVRSHGLQLCRIAFLLTGDRHLAEDVVQASLAKAAVRWERIVAAGDPTPYVRQVIVHEAIAWRRRRSNCEVPVAVVPEVPLDSSPELSLDRRDRLQHALVRVPARQRAAVVLRFYEDLSEAETARAMGCSVGTVKSQTAKGLARLRELLGEGPVALSGGKTRASAEFTVAPASSRT